MQEQAKRPRLYQQAQWPRGVNEQGLQFDSATGHPLVRMFDYMGLAEVIGTPEDNRKFWQSAPFEQVERFMLWANGVIRGIPITERGYFDQYLLLGSTTNPLDRIETVRYVGPKTPQAREMLRRVWVASQEIEDDTRAATLLALGRVISHNFKYGNGRMARLEYVVRSEGYDGSPQAKAKLEGILQNEAHGDLYFNPRRAMLHEKFCWYKTKQLCQKDGYKGPNPLSIDTTYSKKFGQEARYNPLGQQVLFHIVERDFAVPLFTELLLERKVDLRDCMDRHRSMSLTKALRKLGAEDHFDLFARELIKTSENHKMEHIQTLIDCLVYGEDSVYGSPDAIVETYRFGKSREEAQEQAKVLSNSRGSERIWRLGAGLLGRPKS